MAYSASGLTLVGGSSVQRMWIYTTADAIADVNTADYFLDAIGEIRVNDVITVVSSTGGTPVVSHAYCNSNTGSAIDIINGVAITATDSD
jgi:hypothetical protein